MSRKLVVLGYHNVTPTPRFAAVGGGAEALHRQLRMLRRVANVVPLESALATLDAGGTLLPRAVALTFDDGYRDNLTHATPVLRALGLTATIYLVPGFLSHDVPAWWERLAWGLRTARAPHVAFEGAMLPLGTPTERAAALRVIESGVKRTDHATRITAVEDVVARCEPGGFYDSHELYLDWDGARALVGAGCWTVGAHTNGHAILARETPDAQHRDLADCRALLHTELGVDATGLAYPNGEQADYDETTIAAARETGYTYAVTTWGRLADTGRGPYEIGRRMVTTTEEPWHLAAAVLRSHLR